MTGPLHQARVSDIKSSTRDFTSADPSMAEFGAESCETEGSYLWMPLEQIQSVEAVFYDTLGRPVDGYVLDWAEDIHTVTGIPWIRSGQEAISGILLVFKYSYHSAYDAQKK